jgi:hypothetical protein
VQVPFSQSGRVNGIAGMLLMKCAAVGVVAGDGGGDGSAAAPAHEVYLRRSVQLGCRDDAVVGALLKVDHVTALRCRACPLHRCTDTPHCVVLVYGVASRR